MAVNWRKVLAVVAIFIIVVLTGFLLYWFLGRKSDEKPVSYKVVEFTEQGKTTSYNGDQLPRDTHNECGEPFSFNKSATGDFIAPGGTFGWTANLEYTAAEGVELPLCGGSIINSRYILTAAHCVYGKDKQKLRLEKIKLGLTRDYNSTSCDVLGNCVQATFVGIEQIIPHHLYNPLSTIYHSDIALIRVDQDIAFNKFVKPICLRNSTSLGGAKYLAGWPKYIKESKREPRKYVSVLSYPIEQKCNAHFLENYKTDIEKTQLCGEGDYENRFCITESGNAVAAIVNERWYAEGIDSFGRKCGQIGSMGIYTEVAKYMDWIKETIKK